MDWNIRFFSKVHYIVDAITPKFIEGALDERYYRGNAKEAVDDLDRKIAFAKNDEEVDKLIAEKERMKNIYKI